MINLDKKAFLFIISNTISLVLGFFLYLAVVFTSEENLAKLMFTYSIHLILGAILTFGSNLYLFNGLTQLKNYKFKLNFIQNNNFFVLKVIIISLIIVIVLSVLDLIIAPYRKNFNLSLWPLFLGSTLLALNKIIYFCFLGFKFYKKCYSIIILRPLILFLSVIFFIFKSDLSFEIFITVSFTLAEMFVLFISLNKLKKINFFKINFDKKNNLTSIKSSLKLFGDYIFAEIILKIDIFFSMIKFELKNISVYLISLVFIEGMLTFTIVFRNYFSSKYGKYIINNNFITYLDNFKKIAGLSFLITISLIVCSLLVLFILKIYLSFIDHTVLFYLLIMSISYLIYSIFGVSELIFLNSNNYLKQTYYFLTAFFVQLFCIISLIDKIGILSFPISISVMFLSMSLFIFFELIKIKKNKQNSIKII